MTHARARRPIAATERALAAMLESLGYDQQGERRGAARRAATLWHDVLLRGRDVDPRALLRPGIPSDSDGPVYLRDVDVHLVCPHHLTVAFGTARLGYVPGGRIVGFGALSRLIDASCSRLVLQEDATHTIAAALVDALGAVAAVAAIDAVHPCHNLSEPLAHRSSVSTVARVGDRRALRGLEAGLATCPSSSTRRPSRRRAGAR